MIRTGLYLRVSHRKKGISIPAQLARLRAEAEANNEEIVAIFVDQARSGAQAVNRKEYQNLLAAARQRAFDRVRVESVDRGHRNDFDRRAFEMEMQRYGISVLYCGESQKEGPQYRKLRRGLSGVVAEYQSDDISQKSYKRHKFRAERGKWRGGPCPYGLRPDGRGWFEPDPESYAYLLWILERRAEALGYHAITKLINRGVSLNGEDIHIPPTPSVLAHRRRPYIEHQDPDTGDVLQLPKPDPAVFWGKKTIERICKETIDGVYAGIYVWGKTYRRFEDDDEGNSKQVIRVDTGQPLVAAELLQRVQAVELGTEEWEPSTMAAHNSYLLSLRCGLCGGTMPGYTSTKYKGEKEYKYRKYRCRSRSHKPGKCRMPIFSADLLEERVFDAVFVHYAWHAPDQLTYEINQAIDRRRQEILKGLEIVGQELKLCARRRETALDTISDPHLSPVLRTAFLRRAEEAVQAYEELESKQRTLQTGLRILDDQARIISLALNNPLLDPSRKQLPEVASALRRALKLLIHRAEVVRKGPNAYAVRLWLYTIDGLAEGKNRQSGSGESALSPRDTNVFYIKKEKPQIWQPA